MTSTTAFVLLVLVLLAVLARQELLRHRSASPRPRLFGSGVADPDLAREVHDLGAISAHGQAPFVR